MDRQRIKDHYRENRKQIDERLEDFRELRNAEDDRIFQELVFVILSSQSSAENAWKAAEELERNGLLIDGDENQIAEVLRRNNIQYEENKASYIAENREKLSQPTLTQPSKKLKLHNRIDPENLDKTREQLVNELKGVSWKGASHFLRNIGYGNSFAIVSGYIAKSLFKLDLKKDPEQPKDKAEYMEMEEKLQNLSEELGIDIKALDLVLWSMETGEVFK